MPLIKAHSSDKRRGNISKLSWNNCQFCFCHGQPPKVGYRILDAAQNSFTATNFLVDPSTECEKKYSICPNVGSAASLRATIDESLFPADSCVLLHTTSRPETDATCLFVTTIPDDSSLSGG